MASNSRTISPFTPNRKPIWINQAIGATVIMNLAMLVLAAVGWNRAQHLSLPVSPIISGFAVFLPIVNAIGLSHGIARSKGNRQALKSFRVSLYIVLLTILDTVLVALSASHLPSSESNCRLSQGWQEMFHNKDETHIKTIQDALNCCGFKSVADMPFPRPSGNKDHPGPKCSEVFHRDTPCFQSWSQQDKMVAIFYVVVGLGLGLMKVAGWIAVNHDELRRNTGDAQDSESRPELPRLIEEHSDEEEEGEDENGRPQAIREPHERTGLLLPQNNGMHASANAWDV